MIVASDTDLRLVALYRKFFNTLNKARILLAYIFVQYNIIVSTNLWDRVTAGVLEWLQLVSGACQTGWTRVDLPETWLRALMQKGQTWKPSVPQRKDWTATVDFRKTFAWGLVQV